MKELLNLILGNEPIINHLGFLFFSLLGMLLIKLWRYNLEKKELIDQTPRVYLKFSFKYWLNDNLLDFVCAFVTSFVAYRFLKDVQLALGKWIEVIPHFSDNMFYGFLLGLSFQYITHKIMNKFKIVN